MKVLQIMVVSLLFVVLFISCNQDDLIAEQAIVQDKEVSVLENSSSARLATSGLYPVYEVKPEIMMHFRHFYQLNATGNVNGSAACGPTSYMMASSCIARYINPNTAYTTSASKLQNIVQTTGVSTSLSTLSNYAINYDNSFLSVATSYGSNREVIKTFIKNALLADKFVITGVNAYVIRPSPVSNWNYYSNSSLNGDLNAGSDVKTGTYKNYISSSNEGGKVGGHIIVIIRFVQTAADGSGYVEYIDPIAPPHSPSNRRYVSFSRLLDAIKMNGNNVYYDAFSLGVKGCINFFNSLTLYSRRV